MGDNAAAGLLDKAGARGGPGDGTENVVLLDPEPLGRYAVVPPFEGDDNVECPLIRFPCS